MRKRTGGWVHPPSAKARRCAHGAAVVLLCVGLPAAADYRVDAGTTFAGTGRFDLACTDLIVAGALNLDAGTFFNVRDVVVNPGGVVNGGSGSIALSRDFTVQPGGTFNPQGSSVIYDTNCGPGAPERPIPALGTGMLAAMSGVLAVLAMHFLGGVRRRRGISKGAEK